MSATHAERAPGFAVVGSPVELPGVRLAIRAGILEAVLDEGGALAIAPRRLLLRIGVARITADPAGGLARASGSGRLALARGSPGAIVLLMLSPGRTLDLNPEGLLAATPYPTAGLLPIRGGWLRPHPAAGATPVHPSASLHPPTLLRLCAPLDQPAFLALSARGGYLYRALAAGQALDIAPTALLAADSEIDLARGEHLHVGSSGGTERQSYHFVQCLGPGAVCLQTGHHERQER